MWLRQMLAVAVVAALGPATAGFGQPGQTPGTPGNGGPSGLITVDNPGTPGGTDVTLTASAFVSDPFAEGHSQSRWILGSNRDVVWGLGPGTIYLDVTTAGATVSLLLDNSTNPWTTNPSSPSTVYWTVAYKDVSGDWSAFSEPTRFRYSTNAYVWNGGSDDFGLGGNWLVGGSPPGVGPGPGDDVIVQMWGPDPKLYAATQINHLFITDANQSVTLLLNGNTLDVQGGFALEESAGWDAALDLGSGGALYVAEDFWAGAGTLINYNADAAVEMIRFYGSANQDITAEGGWYSLPYLQFDLFTASKARILLGISCLGIDIFGNRYVQVLNNVSCSGDVTVNQASILEVGDGTIPLTFYIQGNLSSGPTTQVRLRADTTLDMEWGGSILLDGAFITSNPNKPQITSGTAGSYAMTLNGPINVNGLVLDKLGASGLQLGSTGTITNFRNVEFQAGPLGVNYLNFAHTGSEQFRIVGAMFDGFTGRNITTAAGFTGEVRVMWDPGSAGWGGTYENDAGNNTVEPGGTITWIPGYVLKTVSASDPTADHPSFTSAVSSLIAISPLDVPYVVQGLDWGPYAEQICLTGVSTQPGVPLDIRGNATTSTRIDAGGFTRGIHVDGSAGLSNVTILNFDVTNILGVSGGGIAGIHVENGATNVSIADCDIFNLGAGTVGILVETSSDNAWITDNEVHAAGGAEGIHVGANAPVIDHNIVTGSPFGITLHEASPNNAMVYHNTVAVPGWAFALDNVWNPSGVQVYNNIFVSTAAPGSGGGMYIPSGFSGPSPDPFSGGRSNYNAFFMPNGAAISSDGAGTTNWTLSAHQTWTLGQDMNSFEGLDPLFLNSATPDFHLQSFAGTYNDSTGAHDLFPAGYSPFMDAGDPFTPYGNELPPTFGPELGAYGDTPEASLSDGGPPTVSVIYPAGGEVLTGTIAISWATVDQAPGTVDILLSDDGGATFPYTLASGIPDTGSSPWDTTTWPDGFGYVIRITATDTSGQTGTAWSGPFTLDHTSPTVEWTYPVGGEVLYGVPWVSWTTTDANPFQAAVFLSSDSGASYPFPVAGGISDGGGTTFDTTAYPNGTTYRLLVQVWDGVGNMASATTPGDFTIDNVVGPSYPPLTPTEPFFGSTVYWSDVWLQWVPEPTAVDYKIEVSPDPFFSTVTEYFSSWPEYTLTGLAEGTVFWRVSFMLDAAAGGGWSPPGPISAFNVLFTPFPGTISVTLTGGTTVDAYRMFGFPASAYGWDVVSQMEATLGPYDTIQWRSFRWDPLGGAYEEFPFGSMDYDHEAAGTAVWLLSRNTTSFTATGYDTSAADYWSIMLEPGWNQVGDPYLAPVLWSDVLVSDGFNTYYAADPSNPLLVPYAYYYEAGYSSAVELTPYYGVFVYANGGSGGPLMLIVPRPAGLLKAGRESRPPSTEPLPAGAPLPPSPPGSSGASSSGSSRGGGGGGGGCTASGAAAGWALLAGLCLAVGLASCRHRVP